jgi:predicted Rossmann fold flavoprotein
MSLNPDSEWDVIVVGAGAAGMMAAIAAGRRGCRTLLLEKNRKPGVKILMSGGTRCNLTHATDAAGIITAFGRQGRFLRRALVEFDPQRVVSFFHDAGVETKVESTGKIFPQSDRALDVQQALWRAAQRAGVESVLDAAVQRIDLSQRLWQVTTSAATWRGRRLIVTTGGCSYPGCGTRGDAYAWMQTLGHAVVTPRPALVPLTSPSLVVKALQGLTVEDALLRVVPAERMPATQDMSERLAVIRKACREQRRGSLLFTHFGVSGPVAMDVSRQFTAEDDPRALRLICDLLPELSAEELLKRLVDSAADQGTRSVVRSVSSWLPGRLAESLLTLASISPSQRLAELSKAQRRDLIRQVKSLEIPIDGSRGFGKAEVTAGGVALGEVDSRTMASKIVPGLFIAGELLDVDGPIGGYNFQAAFSTGWVAGTGQ